MHRSTNSKSGYAQIAQAEEEEARYHDEPVEDPFQSPTTVSTAPQNGTTQPARRTAMPTYNTSLPSSARKRRTGRQRSHSAVDVKAINARLERWAEEIAAKFNLRKIKGKSADEERLEIHHSVFTAPDDMRPLSADSLAARFMELPPNRISKLEFDDVVESVKVAIEMGTHPKMITQGSSGSYFARNSKGEVVGVFKPKDEEPYATKNPKWTKWIHRNLFPFFFGRACLIPNLSYVSEAAAYVLDMRLQTNIVPYTDIIYLSSPSFNYDFWDRRAYYRRRKPLPMKVGSLQVFLKGYKDATIFLKKYPWPDQPNATIRVSKPKRRRWADGCGPVSGGDDEGEEEPQPSSSNASFWTEALQISFREELEKLVILDYIMRNTDRGLDNWMIKIDPDTQKAKIVAEPPKMADVPENGHLQPAKREEVMTSRAASPMSEKPIMSLGAIDNSLSWPWKHPDADADFKERMFARQIAVMKGQAWNVVETLKTPEHGPLELTRRARVCVWDDLVDIPTVVPLRESEEQGKETRNGTNGPTADQDIPSSKRFNVSREGSSEDGSKVELSPPAGDSSKGVTIQTRSVPQLKATRPGAPRSRTRVSFESTRPWQREAVHHRQLSFSHRVADPDDSEDDGDGDLGFSAARDREGNRKRVIVERLEMIKSKGPFFTWC